MRRAAQHAKIHALCALTCLLLAGCSPGGETGGESLLVFCGSANKPAMEEIAARFEEEKGIAVNMIFGGSGTLLSKIELSRKGDIYLPGSPDYIIIGNRRKLLVPGSESTVAYLVPGIITPAGNPAGIRSLDDLARPGTRVGIGNPETVCLGLYGVELLEKNGLLGPVMENVVTFGASCSKTAHLAAMDQVDAILGWRVFHFWNPERMDYVPIEPERIPRVSYISIAIPSFTGNAGISKDFISFTLSPQGRKAYEKYGYITSREQALEFAPEASIGGEYTLPQEYFRCLERMGGER